MSEKMRATFFDRVLPMITSGLLVALVIWTASTAKSAVTKDDVSEQIKLESPYRDDRQMLQEGLRNIRKLTESINENTAAINALKVEIAGQIKPT